MCSLDNPLLYTEEAFVRREMAFHYYTIHSSLTTTTSRKGDRVWHDIHTVGGLGRDVRVERSCGISSEVLDPATPFNPAPLFSKKPDALSLYAPFPTTTKPYRTPHEYADFTFFSYLIIPSHI